MSSPGRLWGRRAGRGITRSSGGCQRRRSGGGSRCGERRGVGAGTVWMAARTGLLQPPPGWAANGQDHSRGGDVGHLGDGAPQHGRVDRPRRGDVEGRGERVRDNGVDGVPAEARLLLQPRGCHREGGVRNRTGNGSKCRDESPKESAWASDQAGGEGRMHRDWNRGERRRERRERLLTATSPRMFATAPGDRVSTPGPEKA